MASSEKSETDRQKTLGTGENDYPASKTRGKRKQRVVYKEVTTHSHTPLVERTSALGEEKIQVFVMISVISRWSQTGGELQQKGLKEMRMLGDTRCCDHGNGRRNKNLNISESKLFLLTNMRFSMYKVRQPETNPSPRYTVTPHHGPVMAAIPFIRPSHPPGASQLLDHDLCSSQVISPPLHS